MHQLHIEVDPSAIPNHIDVDVSNVKLGKSLHVSDLPVVAGIKIMDEPGATVCVVAAPKVHADAPAEGSADTGAFLNWLADAATGRSSRPRTKVAATPAARSALCVIVRVVVGAAGDRRDQDIREMGELAAKWFDHVIIREDDCGCDHDAGYSVSSSRGYSSQVIDERDFAGTLRFFFGAWCRRFSHGPILG